MELGRHQCISWRRFVSQAPVGKIPTERRLHAILMYSNLQQPKADFSSQGPVFPLSWRAELELNIQ